MQGYLRKLSGTPAEKLLYEYYHQADLIEQKEANYDDYVQQMWKDFPNSTGNYWKG